MTLNHVGVFINNSTFTNMEMGKFFPPAHVRAFIHSFVPDHLYDAFSADPKIYFKDHLAPFDELFIYIKPTVESFYQRFKKGKFGYNIF